MPVFDTRVPHNARVYNYLLGGKDNYVVDREAGDRFMAAYPHVVHSVRANREFLARAVRFLVAEAGIRQKPRSAWSPGRRQFNESGGERATHRDRAAVTGLFDGCELVEPGVVRVSRWRPDSEVQAVRNGSVWAGVAQKL